jgi:hypothetical protein
MVTAIFKASKFIDNIFIYCRLTLNYIKQSYSTNTLKPREVAPAYDEDEVVLLFYKFSLICSITSKKVPT